jgi:hypothetical protein
VNDKKQSITRKLELRSQHLFDMAVRLQQPLAVGDTPKGNRQILPGEDGEFNGSRLSGKILPGGADWFLVRADGVGELDVRVTLETDDSQLIYMRSEGFLHYPAELTNQVLMGQADPAEYYLRERTVFETAAEKYYWLNSIIAVGVGWYQPGLVGMSIYEIE